MIALLIVGLLAYLIILGIGSLFKSKEVIAYEEIQKETLLDNERPASTEVFEEQEVEVENKESIKIKYRMTYYYPNDGTNSGTVTASGKSTKDFQTNENGWYTYKGKLVVATASKRLLSWDSYKDSTQQTYNLYDEFILTIQGTEYEAIALDVCGACMKSEKIDLFVKDRKSGLDTKIEVEVK